MSMDGPISVARLLHLCSGDPLHSAVPGNQNVPGNQGGVPKNYRSFLGVSGVEEGTQEGDKPVNGGLLVKNVAFSVVS